MEPVELPEVEFSMADNIFIKQMLMEKAGTFVPQHSHKYGHTSMLAVGSVRLWKDDVWVGDFKAPMPIFIEAESLHTFQSLEPNTIVYCIHNTERTGDVEIHEHAEEVSQTVIKEALCLGQQQQ